MDSASEVWSVDGMSGFVLALLAETFVKFLEMFTLLFGPVRPPFANGVRLALSGLDREHEGNSLLPDLEVCSFLGNKRIPFKVRDDDVSKINSLGNTNPARTLLRNEAKLAALPVRLNKPDGVFVIVSHRDAEF